MKTLTDLLREIDASIERIDKALEMTNEVPQGHRVQMVRGQLEAARETLVQSQGFCKAKISGLYAIQLDKGKD